MLKVLSGVRPTGDMHLGNYLGAFKAWVEDQYSYDAFYCVVDLHALAEEINPEVLRDRTLKTALTLLAVGLDPSKCTLFIQSHVPAHAEMSWLLSCVATYGELGRMTQFKDKSHGKDTVRVGLYTYPVLMASDILLYQAQRVPVGHDQKQHLELTRDIAMRFNNKYGEVFTIPTAFVPKVGARVMDLQDPTAKMSKSSNNSSGIIYVLEDPSSIEKKIKRAVTDTNSDVIYDPKSRPGVSNLLELLGAATDSKPEDLAPKYQNYGSLKLDTSKAVIEMLDPIRQRVKDLEKDLGEVHRIIAAGAQKAAESANATLERAKEAMGLLS
ncbi:MAG: tryptophan--tRNA ligase [Acidimicrobiales bacterium]|nr:tryptophan--tRNA ligase [Acidimicrobiales bacterium]